MKERQRWQPEEDALLRAYVKQYGPREWNLVSQRMGKPLDRDAKSCLERWKNYLKPGIKKGSLTEEEQSLVISLQAKYGNKWKKIAAEVPGRTAKRLGKWWEVFKEKQLKEKRKEKQLLDSSSSKELGRYDHILETFAEKYVQRKISPATLPPLLVPCASPSPLLTLTGRSDTFSDNFLSNLKATPIPSDASVLQMENISVSVGPNVPDLKGKAMAGSELGPKLTLESLGRTSSVPDPNLALQCSSSVVELDLTTTSLGSSTFVDANSSLPPWMSSATTAQSSALGSSDVRTTQPPYRADKDASFFSKTTHINSSPSVSLSLSPTSSDLIVSSGSASPASEVVAPRSWLQDFNGVSGAVVKEGKVNWPWSLSEKQIGLLSLDSNTGKQAIDNTIIHPLPIFLQYCKDLEEGRQSWLMHKKEATWRLSRLEQQLESEKVRKKKEKIEQIGAKIRALREEEMAYLEKLDMECKEQLSILQKEAEMKEAKMIESWSTKHLQLMKFIEQAVCQYPDAQRLVKKDMN